MLAIFDKCAAKNDRIPDQGFNTIFTGEAPERGFMYTLVYVMKNIDTEEIIETTEIPEKRYLENVCDYVCIDEYTRWEDEKEV